MKWRAHYWSVDRYRTIEVTGDNIFEAWQAASEKIDFPVTAVQPIFD